MKRLFLFIVILFFIIPKPKAGSESSESGHGASYIEEVHDSRMEVFPADPFNPNNGICYFIVTTEVSYRCVGTGNISCNEMDSGYTYTNEYVDDCI